MAFMVCSEKKISSQQEFQILKMVVNGDGCLAFDEASGLSPSSSLPVVFPLFLGNPRRQRLIQVAGQRVDVRFVHAAQFGEPSVGNFAVIQFQAMFGEHIADAPQLGWWQTIGSKL